MDWLLTLGTGTTIGGLLLIICVVSALGIALGHISYKRISIGIGGVLFIGLAAAHLLWGEHNLLGVHLDPAKIEGREKFLELLREGGLILFVYAVGMMAGPGFLSSFRANGLTWNVLAVCTVLMGWGIGIAVYHVLGIPVENAIGLLSGAVTNTPGLGAAQEAFKTALPASASAGVLTAKAAASAATVTYAVTYPMGIMGVIASMLLIRFFFRIDPAKELAAFQAEQARSRPKPDVTTLETVNPGLVGKTLADIQRDHGHGVRFSRVCRDGLCRIANENTVLQAGDLLTVVGDKAAIARLITVFGGTSSRDLRSEPGQLTVQRIVVTNDKSAGKTVEELDLPDDGIAITRIIRGGIEFVATDGMRIQLGDTLVVVGGAADITAITPVLGNTVSHLEKPRLPPMLVAIGIGLLLGSIPFAIPGLPAPVRLGLAGGPLLAALILNQMGRLGPLHFHMSHGALHVLREFGIVVFLAAVGLKSGAEFVDKAFTAQGLEWFLAGCCITILPVMIMGLVGRLVFKINYTALIGLMAGSMTDPPALAFATSTVNNEAPSMAYASVYPTVMILRILSAQIFVLLLL